MSPTTPTYLLPYPAAADPADVPIDMQELADRIEAILAGQAAALVPACILSHSGAYSVASATWVALALDTERLDTDNMHATSPNPERITIKTAGLYRFTLNVPFATAGGGNRREAIIRLNGATALGRSSVLTNPAQSVDCHHSVSAVRACIVGDYVTAEVFQDTGGGQLLSAPGPYTALEFAGTRLGRAA